MPASPLQWTSPTLIGPGMGVALDHLAFLTFPVDTPPESDTPFTKEGPDSGNVAAEHWAASKVRLEPFYHPYVYKVREILHRYGVRGLRDYNLLSPEEALQEHSEDYLEHLEPNPGAIKYVVNVQPDIGLRDEFEFRFGGAYSTYNWELFFHGPMLIGSWLMRSGRHREAREWFHAVFHPTDVDVDEPLSNVWRFKPFRTIQEIDTSSADDATWLKKMLGDEAAEVDEVTIDQQIEAWQRDPFNPHLLARMRPLAYMKWTARLYYQNLVEWADKLFRQDTVETIVEAQQLYMLAARLLGPRPIVIQSIAEPAVGTFIQLQALLQDELSNPLVALEDTLFDSEVVGFVEGAPPIDTTHFCMPRNESIVALWDTVADRLFKLRNCMNIEGVVRELPLFEPPIDPALLVRARAAGLDLSSVLSDLRGPPPLHRFPVLYQRALDLASFVAGLGGQLLAALEKKDAETLGLLRSTHEISLLEMVRETRRQAVKETEENLAAVKESRKITESRREHYAKLLDDGEELSAGNIGTATSRERHAIELQSRASLEQMMGSQMQALGQALGAIPQFELGFSMGGHSVTSWGGSNLASLAQGAAGYVLSTAATTRDQAAYESTMAQYDRRAEEWQLQLSLAEAELTKIDREVAAAEIRKEIAELELSSHERQVAQATEIREFLEDKFTNDDLYLWMQGELQTTYHQAYKLAFDLARRAERAYQYERAEPEASFVSFGYWDGIRKGLLVGEKLGLDLRRMDAAYLEKDRREYEITKSFSLAEHAPDKLLALRESGMVYVDLPEVLFDLDYPGHYHRRIKSVSITIPAVTGPYTGVSCTLTLLSSKVRTESLLGAGYAETPLGEDSRFRYNFGAVSSVCTSQGLSDSGMFELSFRDEKLLPFEGAGAVSKWRVELPAATNRFDLRSVSDVILQIQYCAREAGGALREGALGAAFGGDTPRAVRLLSVKNELPDAWSEFENELDDENSNAQLLSLDLAGSIPFIPGVGPTRLKTLRLALVVDSADPVPISVPVDAEIGAWSDEMSLQPSSVFLAVASPGVELGIEDLAVSISQATLDTLGAALAEDHPTVSGEKRLRPDVVRDIVVVLELERDRPTT